MKFIIKKYIVITISLLILISLVTSIKIAGDWKSFLYASFTFTILYFIGRPIANLVMLPINLLTLNLFSWIINILLFYIWTVVTNGIQIGLWRFQGFNFGPLVLSEYNFASWQVIIISSIMMTLIVQFIGWLIK